jgi:signal transduction histidine kinase
MLEPAGTSRNDDESGLHAPGVGDPASDYQPVSGASRRLRALAALSGSLTDSLGPEEAANLVEREALSALGATSAVVVTLGAFPATVAPIDIQLESQRPTILHVVHAIGLPAEVKAALDELPLDAPVPLAEVARTGEALFLDSRADLGRYPEWGAAMMKVGAQAAAIVPVWANGHLRGVLGLAWPAPRIFDEDERAFVLTLGVMCAQSIMRAHLKHAEHQARQAAELANQSKTHFLATLSHELRTPMNAVLGYTDLIADEICGPITLLQKDHLGRVQASGKHLLGLIEELLGYARVEAGEEIVRAERVRLADLVEQSLVLVRPIATKKGVHIRVENRAGEIELNTDPHKLRQILINVVANAVKFAEGGDVVLVLRVDGAVGEVVVYFEVTDSGRGIDAVDHERVFEAFWQKDSSRTRTTGGTGLGLAVARQLAQLLGGDVVVTRSALGEGSTFTVSLPASYRAPAAATT